MKSIYIGKYTCWRGCVICTVSWFAHGSKLEMTNIWCYMILTTTIEAPVSTAPDGIERVARLTRER